MIFDTDGSIVYRTINSSEPEENIVEVVKETQFGEYDNEDNEEYDNESMIMTQPGEVYKSYNDGDDGVVEGTEQHDGFGFLLQASKMS